MILLDTSAFIELIQHGARSDAIQRLCSGESFAISAVTVHEVLTGTTKNPRIRDSIEDIDVLPLTKEAALESAKMQQELVQRGKRSSTTDILIAATAKVHGYTIISADRDFQKMPSVTVKIV